MSKLTKDVSEMMTFLVSNVDSELPEAKKILSAIGKQNPDKPYEENGIYYCARCKQPVGQSVTISGVTITIKLPACECGQRIDWN